MEAGGSKSLLPQLSSIATELTCAKVLEDKMGAMAAEQSGESQESTTAASSAPLKHHGMVEDEEELEMENDPEFRKYKAKRLAELRATKDKNTVNKTKGYGEYREIDETEFLPTVTKNDKVVCHFYHPDFERCKIIDEHLKKICLTHLEAKFVKINAEKSPFFVSKLVIKMLPTIVCFVDGVAVDRVVGFDDLGQRDDFPTLMLTRRLVVSKALNAIKKREAPDFHIVYKKHEESDEDND